MPVFNGNLSLALLQSNQDLADSRDTAQPAIQSDVHAEVN